MWACNKEVVVTVDHKPSMTQPAEALVKDTQGWRWPEWEGEGSFLFQLFREVLLTKGMGCVCVGGASPVPEEGGAVCDQGRAPAGLGKGALQGTHSLSP